MIGSLVIVYPTPHQGGELVLRHKDHEWTFDASSLTSSQYTPSLAYVAFYSDIEHEVLKITSGSRVTVTYSLYLAPPTAGLYNPHTTSVMQNLNDIPNFQETLRRLLQKPEFLPGGGALAFNLTHLYPVTFTTDLRKMIKYLKGEDAHVYQSCRELGLEPALRMIYSESEYRPEHGVMTENIVDGSDYDYMSRNFTGYLLDVQDGVPVNLSNDFVAWRGNYAERTDRQPEQLAWLTDFTDSANELKDRVLAYGNEVTVECVYLNPCLIVPICPASDRV